MGKKGATPKNTFQTPKRNTGNDDDDVVTAPELVDMEARLAKRLDDEKAARDDEKATRDAQMSQLMAAIAALQPRQKSRWWRGSRSEPRHTLFDSSLRELSNDTIFTRRSLFGHD